MKNIIALILIAFTFSGIAQEKTELTLEDIWYSPKFYGKTVTGFKSTKDGKHYTKLDRENGNMVINKYRFADGSKIATLFSDKDQEFKINNYQLSANENFIILGTDIESIYRRSSKGNYFVYNLKDNSVKAISDHNNGKISHPSFSPDGQKIAYVRNNNIFIQDATTGKETQVTKDGKTNEIINGMCDWVYEEEFGFTKAYHWSPKSNQIGFIRFNESDVKEWDLTYYGQLYPEKYKFKYPKAGEKNSDVSVHIYDLKTNTTSTAEFQTDNQDFYIPRIQWRNGKNELIIFKMNRLQNALQFYNFSHNQTPNSFYTETSDTYLDLDFTDFVHFLPDNSFIKTTERNGYAHLYHFSSNGKFLKRITEGNWDISHVYGVDEKGGKIYFQAAKNSAIDLGLYSVSIKGGKIKAISNEEGNHRAVFTKDFSYFVRYSSDANTPSTVTLCKNTGKEVRVLEDNADLIKSLASYNLSKKEFLTVKTKDAELNAWMIKPKNFDPNKKYPVLMTFYNGPGSNMVKNSWTGLTGMWHHYLAQEDYVIFCVDGRGTMYRGVDFKKCTYQQLGKLETIDQINAAKWLGKKSFIDANKIAVFGWSYGGYMSSLCMTKGADVFAAGIAVAPVTNWRYYDSIYTERFMRTPQENPNGYDDNSPINHVEKLKGPYLLVHGDADDNVHVQNTMEMVNALVAADKEFDLFIYPNKNHGIYGGKTRLHLFRKMTNFLNNNL